MMMAEAVEYNLFQILFWPGGGNIGLVLWGLSIVMMALVVQAFLAIRRSTVLPELVRDEVRKMFESKQYREAIEVTSKDTSLLGCVVHSALSEAPRGYSAMEKAMQDSLDDRTAVLLRSTEWLNLLGNIAPMLGLLGTVWGMIQAFFVIVRTGGTDPSKLAEALGIKLVCTFVGLVVAIPSLAVYGIMRNRIDTYAAEAMVIAQGLIGTFRPGKKAE